MVFEKFKGQDWKKRIDVEDFIVSNYTEYTGDDSFLQTSTKKTLRLWKKCEKLLKKELKNGVLDIEVNKVSGIDSFDAGYIDQMFEVIVGLQTDEPLKRIVNLYGGMRAAESALNAYHYELNDNIKEKFNEYRKTHNQGVFDVYNDDIRRARKTGLLTGLPDAYGRGRIIGDYRRVALYGVDILIQAKKNDFKNLLGKMTGPMIELREEISEQIRALEALKRMALKYDIDISKPATNSKEAVQWLYFAYLATVKENNGAAMSLGRTSTFLDIYIEKDLNEGTITEKEAQELIDQFVIKLRLVRHLRTPDYNDLFAGDPTWVTESIAGMLDDKKSFVTKNSYRYLNTLNNLGSAPEPNMTILWSNNLPLNFKKYCTKMSIETDAIQYENDDLMRPIYGSDYAIACCVSAMKVGKQMQYFGARCNLAKALLYAINGGVDEKLGIKVIDGIERIDSEVLNYNEVKKSYFKVLENVASIYVDAMNIIHYMHDKYAYEASQMALHDTIVERLMAFGVAGISVVADSLSAIKYAKVKPVYKDGIAVDFITEGDYPKYGNDDDDVDNIAVEVIEKFSNELKKHELHRRAKHTLSILTITSNVVYGKKTGATPDGRKDTVAFAPGANPMHGRDISGALASLNSVAKIPYKDVCEDGISNTFSIVPSALGSNKNDQIDNLVKILDGYFKQNAQHLNVNVLNREMLIEAMMDPNKYPNLTVRISGYAVNFNRLSKSHQQEIIDRTFHEAL